MNIFEALDAGKGRATLVGVYSTRYVGRNLKWNGYVPFRAKESIDDICGEDLKCNDWIPYVPHKTLTNEDFKLVTPICGNCQSIPEDRQVDVTETGECICCGRQIVPSEPPIPKSWSIYYTLVNETIKAGFSDDAIKSMIPIPETTLLKAKRKHTKVFDGVTCSLGNGNEVKFGLPALIAYQVKELVGKPLMKMTLEWKEEC